MRTTGRHVGAIGAVLTAVVLAAGAVAWACTTATSIEVSPGAGPAGSPATVTARQGADGPVSIRWNGVNGPELATASGSEFSVRVRIPADAQPGVAIIMAVREGSESGRASFEVTPGTYFGDEQSEPDLASSSEPGSANGTASAGTRSGTGTAATTNDTVEEEAVTSAGQTTSGPADATTTGGSPAPAATPGVAASGGATTRSAATGARSATVPSAATPSSATATGLVSAPAAHEAAEPVSAATSANDLWSGFASGEFRGAALDDQVPTSSTSPLTVSAIALAGGLAALMAGFGVAEARRRRAVSQA